MEKNAPFCTKKRNIGQSPSGRQNHIAVEGGSIEIRCVNLDGTKLNCVEELAHFLLNPGWAIPIATRGR
jgi:hypothetical protein